MDNNDDIRALRLQFGNRCRTLRHAAGVSQLEFAILIDMDRSYYASIETGARNVTLQSMAKIADGFQISLSHLLAGVGRAHVSGNLAPLPSTEIPMRQNDEASPEI